MVNGLLKVFILLLLWRLELKGLLCCSWLLSGKDVVILKSIHTILAWFPSLFILGFDTSIVLAILGYNQLLYFYGFYFLLIFFDSLFQNKNLHVAILSIATSFTQFLGYGLGFLKSRFLTKK